MAAIQRQYIYIGAIAEYWSPFELVFIQTQIRAKSI